MREIFVNRSLTDMLPEEIELERMEGIRRHVQKEACGLHECVCAICGRKFEAGSEYRYRLRIGKKQNIYCSHKCFRVDERREQERYRRETLGRAEKTTQQMHVEHAKRRLRHAREKLAHWRAKKADPGFDALTKGEQRNIENRIAKWLAQEVLAMEELEVAKRRAGNLR